MKDNLPESIAAYHFVDTMIEKADGTNSGASFWYGWALREAFAAGINYASQPTTPADELTTCPDCNHTQKKVLYCYRCGHVWR